MAMRIGELLLQAGTIDQNQLEQAMGRQRRFGGRLATNCLAMGYTDERTLSLVLSRQQGVPFVILSRSATPLDLLEDFPLEIARKLEALPVHRAEREVFVAMADPTDIAVLDELRFVTGATIVEHGALSGILHDAIEESYRLKELGTEQFNRGTELDPNVVLGASGHIEIVVGSGQAIQASPAAPAPARDEALEAGADWVERLATTPPPEAPKDAPTRLLLVEDNSELRRMLKLFLEKSGFAVDEAADGTEALRSLQRQLPDALVLDAMLPGVHGFDICYRIKHAESTRHIPVVMISAVYRGWRYADDVRRLYGADAFLEKPLRLDELKHVLDGVLQGRPAGASQADMSEKAAAALQRAAQSYRQGELFEAARHLEQAVEASPFSASLHQRLGVLYEQLEENHRAIAEMSRAVELEPTYDRLLALARLYESTGFVNKAFESWERALRMCQDKGEADRIRAHMEHLLA